MRLEITTRMKLKRPPTSICSAFGRIFVATKGKRIFYAAEEEKPLKSIIFSHQVNSLCTNGDILFCSQSDGNIFGLNSKHKVSFKVNAGNSKIISNIFEEDLFIAPENRKISVFGSNSLLKNTFFQAEIPLIGLDLSGSKLLAAISQNDQYVQLINISTKEKATFRILDGFPETVQFLKEDFVLVGTSKGSLNLFSTITKKRISFIKLGSKISSLYVINDTSVLVGTVDCKASLIDLSEFNKMQLLDQEFVDGIPVEFCSHGSQIACAISRESRLGRWDIVKTAHNQLLTLKLIN